MQALKIWKSMKWLTPAVLRSGHRGYGFRPTCEKPLRAELFSIDQLEKHARKTAASHSVLPKYGTDALLSRLNDNQRVLFEAYDLVAAAADNNSQIEPAAEWLLDNFYLIEDEIREIRNLFPPAYSRELPLIATPNDGERPRVYQIAIELISHVDGRIDASSLNSFIASYQSVEPLLLGELWALPLMLRLALIENLRRVAETIALARFDRDRANKWAQQMTQVAEVRPADLILILADMARESPPLTGAFLAELSRHFHEHNPAFALVKSWLEQRLSEESATVEQVIHAEGQAQAVDQVSFGNSIHSLRFLDANDWKEFVHEHSHVERTLKTDPAGIYSEMDFATRDRYRHAVEDIAKRSPLSEFAVATLAIQLAKSRVSEDFTSRYSHVGYFLIDRGLTTLEKRSRVRLSLTAILKNFRRKFPLACYLTLCGIVSITAFCGYILIVRGMETSWQHLAVVAFPVILSISALGVELSNWISKRLIVPVALPRMAFKSGLTNENRTLVAIPTMLSSQAGIDDLLDGLELRYLSNRDQCLHFALLTDLKDADACILPGDENLIQQARAGVERLNQKYEAERKDAFFLFHRSREWNASEDCWMGYERKRGKLSALNAMLRGADDRFSQVVGDPSILQNVRYVITLDTDTELPRDAAIKLIGTMAHPLNQPIFDLRRNRVVAGYSILQPQVGVGLQNSQKTRFTRLFSGDSGIDPYTQLVADVYQDLFDEGSFIGKGIYHVDSFESNCTDFPENAILSHDLLEGAYCRSGLVSDVTLYESYPTGYLADMSRRHRWIRGDWQIAGWLRPLVRNRSNEYIQNPLTAISRWKLADNLRRSLIPIGLLSSIILSWFLSFNLAVATALFILGTFLLPVIIEFTSRLLNKPLDLPFGMHFRFSVQRVNRPLLQLLLRFVFLPYEAYISLDAIIRTIVRTCWTRRGLLEWKTASDSESASAESVSGYFRAMASAPLLAGILSIFLLPGDIRTLAWAGPWLFCWTLSPLIAWWLSQPVLKPLPRLSPDQLLFLRMLSRKTWLYFEEYATEQENWLPPDNIQQNPTLTVASRTSPTNIGMALLSNLTAYDFGYSSASQFHNRSRNTLKTLARMERVRGHFLNWYDTRTLKPLYPQYISTVDSGNLAAHLLVFSIGCQECASSPILPPRAFAGISDTLHVILEVVSHLVKTPARARAIDIVESELRKLDETPTSLRCARDSLSELKVAACELKSLELTDPQYRSWVSALETSCVEHGDDLKHLATWLEFPPLSMSDVSLETDDEVDTVSRINRILEGLDSNVTWTEVASLKSTVEPLLNRIQAVAPSKESKWCRELFGVVSVASERAIRRIHEFESLALQARELAEMDFDLLYDSTRDLFSIGYNVSDRRLDSGFYDLLASEARLASYLLVAQGAYHQKHWFALGRLLTNTGRSPSLLSWSGSMFEYLMPLLVMPSYENTLLEASYHSVVRRQIEYGNQRGVPWGISESGYNSIDLNKIYQYKAFGVPGPV